MTRHLLRAATLLALWTIASPRMATGVEPGPTDVWYHDKLITTQLAETTKPDDSSKLRTIFTSRNSIPGEGAFLAVVDALPDSKADELVWLEIDIDFRPNILPRQLKSESEIMAALSGNEIILTPTESYYAMILVGLKEGDSSENRMVRGDLLHPIAATAQLPATWGQVKLHAGR